MTSTPVAPVDLLRGYYWLTPLFWLADLLFDANVRVVALADAPGWRTLYYLFCIGCGVVMYLLPVWTKVLAILESAVNLLLLVLGILLPIYRTIDEVAAGGTPSNPIQAGSVFNFLLAGTITVLALRLQLGELAGRR